MASSTKDNTYKMPQVINARKTKETLHNLKPHPLTGRLIDSHPGTRTRPMKVLILGMSRTGTMSIFSALEQHNYSVYHMSRAVQAPRSNLDLWREGLEAKFYNGKGKKWGREEFDRILGDYDAVADVPCIAFAEELIAAYPEAKVILNMRDVDQWLASMDSTAGVLLRWQSWPWIAPFDPALVLPFWRHAKVVMPATYGTLNDFSSTSPARQKFHEHYQRVRKLTPPERLLEYRVQEGWEPLCSFLNLPVPDNEFPRINDRAQFILGHKVMWWLGFSKMVLKLSAVTIPAAAVSIALWRGKSLSLETWKFW